MSNAQDKIKLRQVFGLSTDIPEYTYVDRQKLDKKFEHYLSSQKHIVIHGASKQGKSCLRKKNLVAENCVVVQCLPSMGTGDVWKAALQKLGVKRIERTSTINEESNNLSSKAGIKAKLPLFGEASGEASGTFGDSEKKETSEVPVHAENDLAILAATLRDGYRRLILEDFHYLPEEARLEVAFGLKALYEENAYAIVVGVWSEQNLITYYNGDLTGRIEEINLTWEVEELEQVLSKGEGALNIEFAPGLRQQLIESAFHNVGLLQRLAEKVCLGAEIYESQPSKKILADIGLLTSARQQIVSDIRQRYTRIAGVFKDGMREGSELHLYGRIYNELIGATEEELISGFSLSALLGRVQTQSVKVRQSDLTQSLERIEKLQATRAITPLLVSYSKSLKKLFLNDREFLFYRKYSGDDANDLMVVFEGASGE